MSRNGDGFDDLFGGGYDDDRDDRRVGGRAERHRAAATSGPGRRRQDRAGYDDPSYDDPGYDEAAYGEAGYGVNSHASDDPDSAGYDPVYADDAGYDGDSAYADDGGYGGGGYGDDDGAGRRGGRGHPEASGGRRPARALPKLIGVLVVVAALLGAGIFGIGKVIGRVGGEPAADYSGIGEGIVVVQIPAGATSSDIGTALAKADVVASGRAFVNVATRDSRALSIQPGTYRLRSKMSAASALDALLDDASSALFRYTISPGDTVRKVLLALSERTGTPLAELEALARDPSSLGLPDYADDNLEGYLFPSTYDVAPDTDPVDVLKEAVARFSAYADEHDVAGRARALGQEPGAIVTVASIIEKEVANENEGPKVARVIYNRLADDSGGFRRLDMDSTTRYALDEYEGPLTQDQLRNNNPYNTRAVPGLPPGAIANPSTWALESALNPADGPWFYFVSMPQTRETVFAATQAEFDDAMAEYHRQGGSE